MNIEQCSVLRVDSGGFKSEDDAPPPAYFLNTFYNYIKIMHTIAFFLHNILVLFSGERAQSPPSTKPFVLPIISKF